VSVLPEGQEALAVCEPGRRNDVERAGRCAAESLAEVELTEVRIGVGGLEVREVL
jgi:hypothetical protein